MFDLGTAQTRRTTACLTRCDLSPAAVIKSITIAAGLGLVVGRSLLYPHDGDVAKAVDTAVALL